MISCIVLILYFSCLPYLINTHVPNMLIVLSSLALNEITQFKQWRFLLEGLTFIKFLNTSSVVILHNRPLRTLYVLGILLWLVYFWVRVQNSLHLCGAESIWAWQAMSYRRLYIFSIYKICISMSLFNSCEFTLTRVSILKIYISARFLRVATHESAMHVHSVLVPQIITWLHLILKMCFLIPFIKRIAT